MTYDKFFSWRAWAVFTALCALSLWYGNQFNKICFLLGLAAIVIMVPGTLRYWKYSLVFDNIRMYCAWLTEHYGGYINPDKSLLFGLYENPYALKSRVKAFSNSQKTFWIYKNYSKFKIVDSDGTTLVLLDNKKVYEFHEGEWLDDLRGAYKARVADHYDDPSDNFTPLHKFKKQKRKNKE